MTAEEKTKEARRERHRHFFNTAESALMAFVTMAAPDSPEEAYIAMEILATLVGRNTEANFGQAVALKLLDEAKGNLVRCGEEVRRTGTDLPTSPEAIH